MECGRRERSGREGAAKITTTAPKARRISRRLRVWLQSPAPTILRAVNVAKCDVDVPQVYRRVGKIRSPQLADDEMSFTVRDIQRYKNNIIRWDLTQRGRS